MQVSQLVHARDRPLSRGDFSTCSRIVIHPYKVEDIVKRVIQDEQNSLQKTIAQTSLPCLASPLIEIYNNEQHWQQKKLRYLEVEQIIQRESLPRWEVAGPLHYGMSLKEMHEAIKNKLRTMCASGHLLSEKAFSKRHDRAEFFPLEGKGDNNLTRIWGAEYINSHLPVNSRFRAPEHFLIINGNATHAIVQVHHARGYPQLSVVVNGYVLSKNISGNDCTQEYTHSSTLQAIGYRDFGPGNLRRDASGSVWIVDTESKGFDIPQVNTEEYVVNEYIKSRFHTLSDKCNAMHHTFTIPLI